MFWKSTRITIYFIYSNATVHRSIEDIIYNSYWHACISQGYQIILNISSSSSGYKDRSWFYIDTFPRWNVVGRYNTPMLNGTLCPHYNLKSMHTTQQTGYIHPMAFNRGPPLKHFWVKVSCCFCIHICISVCQQLMRSVSTWCARGTCGVPHWREYWRRDILQPARDTPIYHKVSLQQLRTTGEPPTFSKVTQW